MTMKLTIKNEDQSNTAVVETVDYDVHDGKDLGTTTGEVKPGESQEVWIHQGRKVVIKEAKPKTD